MKTFMMEASQIFSWNVFEIFETTDFRAPANLDIETIISALFWDSQYYSGKLDISSLKIYRKNGIGFWQLNFEVLKPNRHTYE